MQNTQSAFDVTISKNSLLCRITARQLGFTPQHIWCPTPAGDHSHRHYALPQQMTMGMRGSVEAGDKFTPNPLAVVLSDTTHRAAVTVRADAGWHLWNNVQFDATEKHLTIRMDLEGHSDPAAVAPHVSVHTQTGTADDDPPGLVRALLEGLYPAAYVAPAKKKPQWWCRPIYCGWGDQVGASVAMEGPGRECRALAYCTQGLYQRWVDRLDEANMPFGTICIDAGWSMGGLWKPYPNLWPDMREFIDRQHDKGRKVILWLGLWYLEGLPENWCMKIGNTPLAPDPEHPGYRRYLADSMAFMLGDGPGQLNADGFKVDMLAGTPTERYPGATQHFGRSMGFAKNHPRIVHRGKRWGTELLYHLHKQLYTAAKTVKGDCLITSSAVHPYFHDTFDMVRLHDAVVVDGDVHAGMTSRAGAAGIALPHALIDADNWINGSYDKWLTYTLASWQIGVPCVYFAERYVLGWTNEPLWRPMPMATLKRIAKTLKKHCSA